MLTKADQLPGIHNVSWKREMFRVVLVGGKKPLGEPSGDYYALKVMVGYIWGPKFDPVDKEC